MADPVGSGKTFVSLALAQAVNHGPTACLVPASLSAQWQATADRLSVSVALCSHEQVSRGTLPRATRGLVVIDESHHFRNPHTKRYRHLAPWLVGRTALLVTATPIVNRVVDLAHQLLLTIPDDALALDGVASLRAMLEKQCLQPALGQLVFESDAEPDHRPGRVHSSSLPAEPEHAAVARTITVLNRLRLSRSKPIAGLIRGVFLRATASSPAALVGALRRYRRLLLHARDARQVGQSMDRAELRHFTGELDDQLVWWELLPITKTESEIELSDLSKLGQVIHQVEATAQEADGKLTRLRHLLADGRPTLIFTVSRDTVRYIRHHLADLRIAWCTGERAGIGNATLSRRSVLSWFREPTSSSLAPLHLVVTDVAAEGLDLQRAARVIHYDLPWTPMRMEQREGRSVRYGSPHAQVEVVQFTLPPLLERRLQFESTLARKVKLPAKAGLGPGGRHIWRWRTEVADRFRDRAALAGVASVVSPELGLLAGFSLCLSGQLAPLAATVIWMDRNGAWTEDADIVRAWLALAAEQDQPAEPSSAQLKDWLSLLAQPLRDRLAFTRARRWIVPDPSPAACRAMARLQSLARQAARRHQARRLAELERALALVAGGHTAGEATLIDRLAEAPDPEVPRLIGTLPTRRFEWEQIEVRLTGVVMFGPAHRPAIEVASPECPGFRPPSSTSTEP